MECHTHIRLVIGFHVKYMCTLMVEVHEYSYGVFYYTIYVPCCPFHCLILMVNVHCSLVRITLHNRWSQFSPAKVDLKKFYMQEVLKCASVNDGV